MDKDIYNSYLAICELCNRRTPELFRALPNSYPCSYCNRRVYLCCIKLEQLEINLFLCTLCAKNFTAIEFFLEQYKAFLVSKTDENIENPNYSFWEEQLTNVYMMRENLSYYKKVIRED